MEWKESIESLAKTLGDIAERSPDTKQLIALHAMENLIRILNRPGGLGEFAMGKKIEIMPGENGQALDVDEFKKGLLAITNLINNHKSISRIKDSAIKR